MPVDRPNADRLERRLVVPILFSFSTYISSFIVPQSPLSGSASTLAVLATFYNSEVDNNDSEGEEKEDDEERNFEGYT